MSAALEYQDAPLAAARLEVAQEFQARFQAEERRRRGVKVGDVDWRLLNAIVLDPVEGALRLGRLVGADELAGIHADGDLDWWPNGGEPAWEYALPRMALFFGLYTGKSFDTLERRWCRNPIERLCLLRGCRPGQAAWAIATEFGIEGIPRVNG